MRCPYCQNEETKVVDKRESKENSAARRRRESVKCEKRCTTYERVETSNILVVKKDGKREQFDREKLRRGMLKACEKTPVSADRIEEALNEIEAKVVASENGEVKSTEIGELVMRKLRKLDKVAYIRFASVYKEFADLESFQDELKKLVKKE